MPSDENIDHHKAVKYVEAQADPTASGSFTAAWAVGGKSVTVAGHCPACGGRTTAEFWPGIVGSKAIRVTSRHTTYALPSPVTLFCECGHVHDQRPADALDKGCGRFWLVYLPDDARRPPSGTGQP